MNEQTRQFVRLKMTMRKKEREREKEREKERKNEEGCREIDKNWSQRRSDERMTDR
jgi:hypothetical protein